LFDGNWGYDLSFRYSEIKNTQSGQLVSNTLFNRVLNANDPFFDPTSPQFIGTTVPFNPFTDALRGTFPSNDLPIGAATIFPKDVDISKLATLDLNIYTTELFKLPGGGVGMAFGGQFRRENLDQRPDQTAIVGDQVGSSRTAITHGGRKDFAFFSEISVPIISPEMGIPGFHSLEFNGSGRYEEFRNNDTNVLVPKVGLRWQPLDDSLTVRGTWGEGFREPSLIELFSSPTASLTPVNDRQTGNFDPETTFEFRGNQNLQPEDSRALSFGLVYTPKFVPGLTVSLDFWGIDRTGVVFQPTGQQVADDVFNNGAGATLGTVERDPGTGLITRISTQFLNAGTEKAKGLDMGVQYQYQIPNGWGTLTSLTQATYLDSFEQQIIVGLRTIDPQTGLPFVEKELSGRDSTGTSDDAYLKWKGISRIDWAWNHFDVNATARYTAGFKEGAFFGLHFGHPKGEHYVKATWMFDTQASYDLVFTPPVEEQPVAGYSKDAKEVVRGKDGKAVEPSQTANYSMPCWKSLLNNTSFSIGCNNVFGQDPPNAYGPFNGNATLYPGFIYDPTGRFVYGSITKKF
jgi:iron complex outermembrane receptor protein